VPAAWLRRPRPRTLVFAVLATAIALALAALLRESSPPREIVMATGQEGGMYDTYGHEYQRRLGRLGLRVKLERSNGSLDNLRRLVERRADVAFVQSGTYPLAHDKNGVVRGIATLYVEPLWIFYRRAFHVDGLAQLAGRVVSVGPVDSGTEVVARALLERHGAVGGDSRLVNLPGPEARRRLAVGELDAAFFVTSYRDAGVQELLRRPDIGLLSFRHDEAYTRNFPSLSAVRIPAGLLDLRRDVPAEDVTLLAPAAMLVCREDLHPRVVEMLLRVARAVHGPGDLLNAPLRYPSREGMDVPLHEAADRYFTSGESFLSRVLPYWALRWVFVLPVVAVWLPAMRFLPVLYQWRRNREVTRYYGQLRDAEAAILRAERPEELRAALAACEALGREVVLLARAMPVSRQPDVYEWRQHLALVLDEGRERLRRLTSPESPDPH